MKCAWKQVRAKNKRTKAYREITDQFIQFLESSAGCVMHDVFSHGQNRLFDMYADLHEEVNDAMEDPAADIFKLTDDMPANVREIIERMRKNRKSEADLAEDSVESYKIKLKKCGFDMDAIAEDVSQPDNFGRWGIRKDEESHYVRRCFLADIWLIVQLIHGALLLRLRERHGFGAIRLERAYRALLEDYRAYCTEYLRCTDIGDRKCMTMIKERQARCAEIGVVFEE